MIPQIQKRSRVTPPILSKSTIWIKTWGMQNILLHIHDSDARKTSIYSSSSQAKQDTHRMYELSTSCPWGFHSQLGGWHSKHCFPRFSAPNSSQLQTQNYWGRCSNQCVQRSMAWSADQTSEPENYRLSLDTQTRNMELNLIGSEVGLAQAHWIQIFSPRTPATVDGQLQFKKHDISVNWWNERF